MRKAEMTMAASGYADWAAGKVTGGGRKTIAVDRLADVTRKRAYEAGYLAGIANARGDGDTEGANRMYALNLGDVLEAVGMCPMIASRAYDEGFKVGRGEEAAWIGRHESAAV